MLGLFPPRLDYTCYAFRSTMQCCVVVSVIKRGDKHTGKLPRYRKASCSDIPQAAFSSLICVCLFLDQRLCSAFKGRGQCPTILHESDNLGGVCTGNASHASCIRVVGCNCVHVAGSKTLRYGDFLRG